MGTTTVSSPSSGRLRGPERTGSGAGSAGSRRPASRDRGLLGRRGRDLRAGRATAAGHGGQRGAPGVHRAPVPVSAPPRSTPIGRGRRPRRPRGRVGRGDGGATRRGHGRGSPRTRPRPTPGRRRVVACAPLRSPGRLPHRRFPARPVRVGLPPSDHRNEGDLSEVRAHHSVEWSVAPTVLCCAVGWHQVERSVSTRTMSGPNARIGCDERHTLDRVSLDGQCSSPRRVSDCTDRAGPGAPTVTVGAATGTRRSFGSHVITRTTRVLTDPRAPPPRPHGGGPPRRTGPPRRPLPHGGGDARVERARHDLVDGQVVGGQREDGVGGGQLHVLGDRRAPASRAPAEHAGEREHVVDLVREVAAAGGDDRGVRPRPSGWISGSGLAARTRWRRGPSARSARRAPAGADRPMKTSAPARPRRGRRTVRAGWSLGGHALDGFSRRPGVEEPRESSTDESRTPAASRILAQATPAAPAPEMTTRRSARARSSTAVASAQGGEHHDRRAVLVVVHDRAVERLDQPAFELEAARRRDVLEVDRAERSAAAALTVSTISSTSVVSSTTGWSRARRTS